jgi:hypothetical protein
MSLRRDTTSTTFCHKLDTSGLRASQEEQLMGRLLSGKWPRLCLKDVIQSSQFIHHCGWEEAGLGSDEAVLQFVAKYMADVLRQLRLAGAKQRMQAGHVVPPQVARELAKDAQFLEEAAVTLYVESQHRAAAESMQQRH